MLRMMDVEDGEEEDDDTEEEETDHKTAPHAQSKRMSTFHKSHFIDISNKMPRPRMSPERGHTHTHFVGARAVETHVKISQEHLYTENYRKNAADQNRAADFVRACAVETHVKSRFSYFRFCELDHA